uniref:Serpin domain-containing protein n=1 Tax=Melicertus latisulcatus pemonivirus TaxID=2984278 RepID=A0A9C7C674_9VIRU|nr:MAG: hypothetical [Melicertus latisulcatus pemonivirus]
MYRPPTLDKTTDSAIMHHNRLAGRIFKAVVESQSKVDCSISVGAYCIIRSVAPIVQGAADKTASAVRGVKAFIDDPSLKPKGKNLKTAVRVYTGGKSLNYKQPDYVITSKKKNWHKAAKEIDKKASARMGSPSDKGQEIDGSTTLSIVGTTVFEDKWSEDNNFEKSEDILFYTRGEGEKKTPAIRATVNGVVRSSMEGELCAEIIRLGMTSGAFYWAVMPKIPANKEDLMDLADTIDWGTLPYTFRKTGSAVVYLPKFKTENNYDHLEKILSKAKAGDSMGISTLFCPDRNLSSIFKDSLFSSEDVKVSSRSKIDVMKNCDRRKQVNRGNDSQRKIYIKKELKINKPFLFVHVAENGVIIDMGVYLKPTV